MTTESRTQFNKRRTEKNKLKRKLKHAFVQKQAQDVSTKFKEGEPKKLAWNAIKNLHGLLTGKSGKQTNHTPAVVLQGETTNDPQAACTVFAAHYETLGNEQPSDNFCAETTDTVTSALKSWREGAPQVIESMDSAFTIEELTFALKSMPMWKAGDHDNLICELLRKGGAALHSVILKFINRCWENEVIPETWRCGTIISLYKAGAPEEPGNYRGITLLSVFRKLFGTLLKLRLQNNVNLHESQAAFRNGRGCIDHIYTFARLLPHFPRGRARGPTVDVPVRCLHR